MTERRHATGQEHASLFSDRGLISKYQEHKHLADEFGQKIVLQANRISEAFHEFALINFTEDDVKTHLHPRSKSSTLHGTPRKYTKTYTATWVNDNDKVRELTFVRSMHGKKIETESISLTNPDSNSETNFYLNITNVYYELHEDGAFQVLSIVPMGEKLEPEIIQNSAKKDKKFPDLLDEFKDELALLSSMKKVRNETAITVSEGLQSSVPTP